MKLIPDIYFNVVGILLNLVGILLNIVDILLIFTKCNEFGRHKNMFSSCLSIVSTRLGFD